MVSVPSDRRTEKPASRLLPQHKTHLKASGLSDAQMEECGFYSETDPHEIVALLGNYLSPKSAAKLGACLVIPYHGPTGEPLTYPNGDGNPHAFVRLKPDKPRADRKNHNRKHQVVKPCWATMPRLYFLFLGHARLFPIHPFPLSSPKARRKPREANWKRLRRTYGWRAWWKQVARPKDEDGKGIGPRELIPDLFAVVWAGRQVVIAFDSDIIDKPEVQLAEWHLAEMLREAGAEVRVIRFPASPDGTKVGLDDYLVKHGADVLRQLIDSAAAPARPTGDDDRPTIVIGPDEFRVNAEAIAALADSPNLYQLAAG